MLPADYALPVDRRVRYGLVSQNSQLQYGAIPYGKIESDPQTVLLSANRIQQASQKMPNVQFKILTIPLKPAPCS